MIKLMKEYHNFEYQRRKMELLFFGMSYLILESGQIFKILYFLTIDDTEEEQVYKTSLFEFKYNPVITCQILGIFILPYSTVFLVFKKP